MNTFTKPDPQAKALWRYGIIAPLLHHSDDDPGLLQMLQQLASKTFIHPDGATVRLSAETLRKWLYRYRKGGFADLSDQPRRDKGRQHVNPLLIKTIAGFRKEHPNWTLAIILERLLADGVWNGIKPSRATLYRLAVAKQLHRSPVAGPSTAGRPFAFNAFGQLWMADFMHGPKLRDGRQFKKAILHAIIDDASRYVISARFYWHETVEVLLTEMMIAARRFGLCQRFYTDNGASYSSAHLKQVCARLGIHLVHTPPYRPQGRGKVERFFRTVREQFLSGQQKVLTIDELNSNLNDYLAEYHQRPHSGIGISPLQKRMSIKNTCRPLPVVADIQNLFYMQRACRVYNDITIRLNTRIFEVPGCVPGTRVDVFYLPWDSAWVYYGNDRRKARLLNKTANANRFNHPKGGTT